MLGDKSCVVLHCSIIVPQGLENISCHTHKTDLGTSDLGGKGGGGGGFTDVLNWVGAYTDVLNCDTLLSQPLQNNMK